MSEASEDRHSGIAVMFKEVFRTQGELSLHFVRSNKRNATLERTAVGRSNVVLRKLTQMYRGGQRKEEAEMEDQLANKHKLSKWQQDVLLRRIERMRALPKTRQIELRCVDLDSGSLMEQANNAKGEENFLGDMDYALRLSSRLDESKAGMLKELWRQAEELLQSEQLRRQKTSEDLYSLAKQFEAVRPPTSGNKTSKVAETISNMIRRLEFDASEAKAREKRQERLKQLQRVPGNDSDEKEGAKTARGVRGERTDKGLPLIGGGGTTRWRRRASHTDMHLDGVDEYAAHNHWDPKQVAIFFKEHVYGWGQRETNLCLNIPLTGADIVLYGPADYHESGFAKAMSRQMAMEIKKLDVPEPDGVYTQHPIYGGPRQEKHVLRAYGDFQSPRDRLLGLDRIMPDQKWEQLIRSGFIPGPGQRDIRIDPRLREKYNGQNPTIKREKKKKNDH